MGKYMGAGWGIGILVLVLNCSQPPQHYHRVNKLWIRNLNRILPFDMNGDGIDELVVEHRLQVDVIDQTEKTFFKSFRMGQYNAFNVMPIQGTALDSVSFFVSHQTDDSTFMTFLSHAEREQELRTEHTLFADAKDPRSGYEQGVSYIQDLPYPDGQMSLFRLNTSYNPKAHRGFLAYDLKKDAELWRFTCGPQVYTYDFHDIDDDSFEEIVFGTYAPSNNIVSNGTSDDSSYVFMLDNDGTLMWKQSMGLEFSGAFVCVGNFGKAGSMICVLSKHQSKDKTHDHLQILDPLTGNQVIPPQYFGKSIPYQLNNPARLCADINSDGKDDIIIGNTDGYVRMLDQELNLQHISKPYRREITIDAILDMNGDGTLEIICQLEKERLIILDSSLRELASFPLEIELSHTVQVVKAAHFDRLLLKSSGPAKENVSDTWRLLELESSLIPFETYSGNAKYFWWGLGTLALFSIAVASYKTRIHVLRGHYIRLLKQTQSFSRSLLLDKNLNIKAAGQDWEELSLDKSQFLVDSNIKSSNLIPSTIQSVLEKNLQRRNISIPQFIIEKQHADIPAALDIEYLALLSLYRVYLRYIKEEHFVRNIKHWSGVAQKLAHGIKNPLTAMKLNSEELHFHLQEKRLTDSESLEHLASISLQIDKLRRMADGFMRFSEFGELDLEQTNINQFVEELVSQHQDNLPRDIHLSLEWDNVLPYTLLDQQQFAFVFENVLYNAIDSLNGHGSIMISTHFSQIVDPNVAHITDFIELRIQDTGVGIPPELLQQVTQPYFTTKKEGTGLWASASW